MTQLTVRAYDPQDFVGIKVNERVQETRATQPVQVWAVYHQAHGPAFTLADASGRVVACTGVHHFWQGTGEVWLVLSALAKVYPRILFYLRSLLGYCQTVLGYRRLQAAVREDWPEAVRLVEHLGFTKEVVMKNYGPNGVDQTLYALVQEAPND